MNGLRINFSSKAGDLPFCVSAIASDLRAQYLRFLSGSQKVLAMKKAIAGFYLGLACLFVFSITWGNKVLSQWEPRSSTEKRVEKKNALDQGSLTEKESQGKKLRLFMSPFDLANGLTFKELEDISLDPSYRFAAFLNLIASLWLVWGLRWSRSHP